MVNVTETFTDILKHYFLQMNVVKNYLKERNNFDFIPTIYTGDFGEEAYNYWCIG